MNLLFDTNILIYLAKDRFSKLLPKLIPDNFRIFISVATTAEISSIALQNNWGSKKTELLRILLDEMIIVEISETLIETYAQIDAYSQRRNPAFREYLFDTARNMAKNDLWIASTAALLGLTLVTTDNDFDHLHGVFFDVRKLLPAELKS